MTINGYSTNADEPTVRNLRPRQADNGHSIIQISQYINARALQMRTTLVCECGKKMSGWGDRAHYSYNTHRKATA